jgi:dTDP-4-dehydrorhamnose 3,5-epimerase
MKFIPTDIPDVMVVEPKVFGDERGFFMETWRRSEFAEAGIEAEFVQDNHSRSVKGVLRGLHYQIKQAQGKLVRSIRGDIFDVVVDLRKSSPYFGRWVGVELTEDNKKQLWVPPGFAHGYLVTSDSADVLYRVTEYWAPEYERTLAWDDPEVGVQWPLDPGAAPVLSDKDKIGKSLKEAEVYF